MLKEIEKIFVLKKVESEHQNSLLNALPGIIFTLTLKGEIVQANKLFFEKLGNIYLRSSGEIILKEEFLSKFLNPLKKVFSGKPCHFYLKLNSIHLIKLSCNPEFENGTVKSAVFYSNPDDLQKTDFPLPDSSINLQTFLDNAVIGVKWIGKNGEILFANKAELELLGYTYESYVGKNISAFHTDPHSVKEILNSVCNQTELHSLEAKLKCRNGSYKHVLISSNRINLNATTVLHCCFTRDITSSKQSEAILEFLNNAAKEFSSSLDQKTLYSSIARIIVPEMADCFLLDMLNEKSSELEMVACNHRDPRKIPILKKLREMNSFQIKVGSGITKVLETGIPELYPNISDSMMTSNARNPSHLHLLRKIQPRSAMIVPLKVHNSIAGTLTFIATDSRWMNYNLESLQFAIELANRFSLSYENVKLFKEANEEIKVRRQTESRVADLLNEINSEKTKLETIISTIPGIVWEATLPGNLSDFKINFISNHAMRMLGHEKIKLENLHQNWRFFIHPGDIEFITSKLNSINYQNPEGSLSFRIFNNQGNIMWLETHYTVNFNRNKKPTLIRGVSMDITQMKVLEEKKEDFISIASHELKTPLTSLKAYIQLLERSLDREENGPEKIYIKKTNLYISRLNNLISELLDVSKIQAGKMQYNMLKFDFSELVAECVESIQNLSPKHQVMLSGLNKKMIIGDRQRLEQAFMNFLTNAIKYSPEASQIEISVVTTETEIQVNIKDYGIGIPSENISRIFDRFYRVENESSKFSGLGLGLFISNEIIKRHKGKIGVKSAPGKGSTFIFTLPVCMNNESFL